MHGLPHRGGGGEGVIVMIDITINNLPKLSFSPVGCKDKYEHLIDKKWCAAAVDKSLDWESANQHCGTEGHHNGILAPITDREELKELRSRHGLSENRW